MSEKFTAEYIKGLRETFDAALGNLVFPWPEDAYIVGLAKALPGALDAIEKLNARAEAVEIKANRYEEALQEIDNWAKAYPLEVFPEPDFKRVSEVLEAAGITLDSVSASNMRHVIKGVEQIVKTALEGK